MENKKKNILKAIFSGLIVSILLLITILGCSKQAKAEEVNTTPINDYQNMEELSGTSWLIPLENASIIQVYATNSSVFYSGGYFGYTGHYGTRDIVKGQYYATKYDNEPFYKQGVCYFPNSIYWQKAPLARQQIQLTGTGTPAYFILTFDSMNAYVTEDNASYLYLPRYATLRAMAHDISYLTDLDIVAYISMLEGVQVGKDEILNHPNKYNLYTEDQKNQYGQEQYNEGLRIGGDGVAKSQTWFVGIFNGISQMFGIKIFGGSITLGMLCMVPFAIEFVFVIFKLIRGGD